jgi:hypothetical protein
MMIGNFDYVNGRVIPVMVEFNARLVRDILEGGDRLWDHVLEGTVPRYEIKSLPPENASTKPALSEAERERVDELERKAVTAKLLADRFTEIVNACQKEIRSLHEGHVTRGVKAADVGLSLYSLTVNETPRADAVERLIASGKISRDDR